MKPYFMERFGNPSAKQHSFGWDADAAVEKARAEIASWIGAANPSEIIFTGGATESSNMAIRGILETERDTNTGRNHIITSAIEHKSVLATCRELERKGLATLTVVPVAKDGRVDPETIRAAITPQTVLVSIMAANHEVGSIQPLAQIGQLCKSQGVFFHTDAVQALGKTLVHVQEMGIDLLSLSAHKIYGPKGIGALYIRRKDPRVILPTWCCGGGQERGLRSGTLNVPGIVGLAVAARIAQREMKSESMRLITLRDRLWKGLSKRLDNVLCNGGMAHRLPHNLSVCFEGARADTLMMMVKEIAVSAGSACNSENIEPSGVLKALGLTDMQARSTLRFGLGRWTTETEVDYAVDKISDAVVRLRHDSHD